MEGVAWNLILFQNGEEGERSFCFFEVGIWFFAGIGFVLVKAFLNNIYVGLWFQPVVVAVVDIAKKW